MNFFARTDATSHPAILYARPSSDAILVSGGNATLLDMSGPALSDPNTGAMTAGAYLPAIPAAASNLGSSFALVIGLLLFVMWLESGRKAVVL